MTTDVATCSRDDLETAYAHASSRLLDRYAISISQGEWLDLCLDIVQARPHNTRLVTRQHSGKRFQKAEIWLVKFREFWLPCLWDTRMRCIATFLPEGDRLILGWARSANGVRPATKKEVMETMPPPPEKHPALNATLPAAVAPPNGSPAPVALRAMVAESRRAPAVDVGLIQHLLASPDVRDLYQLDKQTRAVVQYLVEAGIRWDAENPPSATEEAPRA